MEDNSPYLIRDLKIMFKNWFEPIIIQPHSDLTYFHYQDLQPFGLLELTTSWPDIISFVALKPHHCIYFSIFHSAFGSFRNYFKAYVSIYSFDKLVGEPLE